MGHVGHLYESCDIIIGAQPGNPLISYLRYA